MQAKSGISKSPQSPDIGQNSDGGVSDFRISVQSLINKNCHNYRTSNDIDMKLGPVTELDKRNKATSKKIWGWRHVRKLLRHCHFFLIYGQFRAIWIPDSGRTVYKLQSTAVTILYYFCQKMLIFAKKDVDIKIRGPWH